MSEFHAHVGIQTPYIQFPLDDPSSQRLSCYRESCGLVAVGAGVTPRPAHVIANRDATEEKRSGLPDAVAATLNFRYRYTMVGRLVALELCICDHDVSLTTEVKQTLPGEICPHKELVFAVPSAVLVVDNGGRVCILPPDRHNNDDDHGSPR